MAGMFIPSGGDVNRQFYQTLSPVLESEVPKEQVPSRWYARVQFIKVRFSVILGTGYGPQSIPSGLVCSIKMCPCSNCLHKK